MQLHRVEFRGRYGIAQGGVVRIDEHADLANARTGARGERRCFGEAEMARAGRKEIEADVVGLRNEDSVERFGRGNPADLDCGCHEARRYSVASISRAARAGSSARLIGRPITSTLAP